MPEQTPPPQAEDKTPTTRTPEEGAAPSNAQAEPPPLIAAALAPQEGQRWYQALVVPALAVFTALVIGALIIVFSDDQALEAWSRFFRHPPTALSASWQVVSETYRALLTGAFGSPSEVARAITSGELSQIQSALYPLSETVVSATPLIGRLYSAGVLQRLPVGSGPETTPNLPNIIEALNETIPHARSRSSALGACIQWVF